MKIIKEIIVSITLLLSVFAQSQSTKKGDKKYERLAYIDAIEIYENVANQGYKSVDLFEKLGNAYYFNSNYTSAEKWYNELFQLNEPIEPEYYFRYAQCLKADKKIEKADKMMLKFYQLTNDYRGELYFKNKKFLTDNYLSVDHYKIKTLNINSDKSDFGSSFNGNKMYFASNRKFDKAKNKLDKWTNENHYNLISVRFDEKGNPVYLDEVTDEIDSKFNESTPVFTKDGKTIYFTRNNILNNKIGKNTENKILLKIYKATLLEDGKWGNVEELPFNSDNYSCAHPTLNSNETFLFFSSDMPDGKGNSDIFKVRINSDGSFGKPENLGKSINTNGRETFPFIDESDNLFFASDGLPGLGALDVFVSKPVNGNYYEFQNLGEPINSEKDDFCFTKSPFNKIGFISSNRNNPQGFDDIYMFEELPLPETRIIDIELFSSITKDSIENATLKIFDANKNLIKELKTDENGKISIVDLRKDREYFIEIKHPDYFDKEIRIIRKEEPKIRVELDPKFIDVKPGSDLVKLLNIKIYFDLDKFFIRPDAEVELAKIIEVLKKYPSLKVQIRSHTDSRQSATYNLRLSENRAKNTREYLIKKGIIPERLTSKGFGESQLVNDCSDDVPCSIEQHQLNRRSEFIID